MKMMTTNTQQAESSTQSPREKTWKGDHTTHIVEAEKLVHRNVLWAIGAGVIPVPIADVVAVTAVQLKLLKELSSLYGVRFREGLAKKLIGALLWSTGGVGLGAAVGLSIAKLIPVVGTAFGTASIPLFAGAFTHATGQVFTMHFESGGTLLDFDPRAVRAHFERVFREGKGKVVELQAEPAAPPVVAPTSAQAPPRVTPLPAADIMIIEVNYKGAGKHGQLDEYVEIVNRGSAGADLSQWKLSADDPSQEFTFPYGTKLSPSQRIRVYTGEAPLETGGFSFGMKRAIWNDKGDTARLYDATGKLVARFSYGDKKSS